MRKTIKKSRLKGWGGKRRNAGNRIKYSPIVLDFTLESEGDMIKLLKMIPDWILKDKIGTYRGRALAYILKTLIEVTVPIEDCLKRIEKMEIKDNMLATAGVYRPTELWCKAFEALSLEDQETLKRISRKLTDSQIRKLEVI